MLISFSYIILKKSHLQYRFYHIYTIRCNIYTSHQARVMSEQMEHPPFNTGGTSFLRSCFNGINSLSGSWFLFLNLFSLFWVKANFILMYSTNCNSHGFKSPGIGFITIPYTLSQAGWLSLRLLLAIAYLHLLHAILACYFNDAWSQIH